MLRKNRYEPKAGCQSSVDAECVSTDESDSPARQAPRKEKLQLCKKFIEYGCCPYRHKCKFAHGSHQLRRNNEKNSRYKTKECGLFFNEGACGYGDRCNFLHRKIEKTNKLFELRLMHQNFQEVFSEMRASSRLIALLYPQDASS